MEKSTAKPCFVDVIVIGAGISGLSSAYHILKTDPNLTIAVLEAKGRVGGRTCGQELKGPNGRQKFDFGGQWVGRCQPHVMQLLPELSLEVYSHYITGTKVMQLELEKWRKTVPLNDPTLCPNAKEWDSMTYDEALRKYVWTKEARDAIEVTGRCMFGVEPKDMSFLYFLYYAQAAGGVEPLISAEPDMGNELKIKGGAFQICERLCEKIGKDKIFFNHAVSQITQEDHQVFVKTNVDKTFVCNRVILALPPHQTVKIEYFPSLPSEKIYALQRMPVGCLTKVIVTYKTAFWRDKGYSGEFVTNGGDSHRGRCSSGPLNIGFDNTTFSGETPALVTFIGGDQQIEYAKLSPQERRTAVLQSLSEMFGDEALDCVDYGEKNWNEEPYNGGCPVSVATPGVISVIAPGLRHPFKRLHFAGTESATVWCGFLNGGVQAGYRAANEVLYNIRPSSISAKQLEDTYYNIRHHRSDHVTRYRKSKSRKRTRVLRVMMPLTGLLLAAVIFRKRLLTLTAIVSTKYF